MKLLTFTFILIAVSAVYANYVNSVISTLKKRKNNDDDGDYNFESLNFTINKKCLKEYSKYNNCITDINYANHEKVCPSITSDTCQEFYKDPMSFLPSCMDFPKFVNNFPIYAKCFALSNTFLCQKDENGNLCPLSEISLKSSVFITDFEGNQFNKTREITCQSKICREATFNYYSKYEEALSYVDKLVLNITESEYNKSIQKSKNLTDYLNSDECKAMSSAVSTLKFCSGLFISLSLLLLSFY